jgi:hypothetical protein
MWWVLRFLVIISCWAGGHGLKAEWTQLSEAASLPMSKKYRDELRDKIARLDMAKLNEVEKANIRKIKRMLDEPEVYDDEDELERPRMNVGFMLILAIAGGVVYWWNRTAKREIPGPAPNGLRDARLRKYQ